MDNNEEISGLHGASMTDQVSYVIDAIKYIRSLYPRSSSNGPEVTIIAHSMGGMIARALFLHPSFIPGSVKIIITMATPHTLAPVPLDKDLVYFYDKVNRYWKREFEKGKMNSTHNSLRNVLLISLAGGNRDNLIASDLAEIRHIIPTSNGFTSFAISIPNAWASCDHLAILWCNQLLKAVAASLYSSRIHDPSMSLRKRMNEMSLILKSGMSRSKSVDIINESSYLPKTSSACKILPKIIQLPGRDTETFNETCFRLPLYSKSSNQRLSMLTGDTFNGQIFGVNFCQVNKSNLQWNCSSLMSLAFPLPLDKHSSTANKLSSLWHIDLLLPPFSKEDDMFVLIEIFSKNEFAKLFFYAEITQNMEVVSQFNFLGVYLLFFMVPLSFF